MKVTNPTITTLTVTWNPADGNVQGYKVIYVPADGGLEIVVRSQINPGTQITAKSGGQDPKKRGKTKLQAPVR